jgi:hypothetical protein
LLGQKIIGRATRNIGPSLANDRARPSLRQEKGFYHNELDDHAALLNEATTDRVL